MNDEIVLLNQLIKINSENPGGSESAIAQFIQGILTEKGIPASIVEPEKGRCSVIAKIKGKSEDAIIFNGHIDTKPAGTGWDTDPFTAKENAQKIYGLGASDMKSGVAAMLAAAGEIADSGIQCNQTLMLHFVADEEMNSRHGTRHLIENGNLAGAKLAIVGEPSEMRIITKSVGNMWLKISSTGRATHAGTYWGGANAIEGLNSFLNAIYSSIRPADAEIKFPHVNVGQISGGNHPGTVPHYCEALIDVRFFGEKNRQTHLDAVMKCANEVSNKSGCIFSIENYGGGGMPAWDFEDSGTKGLLDGIRSAYLRAAGRQAETGCFYGGSDAGIISDSLGIPSLILGPGSIAQAHKPNEWVFAEEVRLARKVYLEIMKGGIW